MSAFAAHTILGDIEEALMLPRTRGMSFPISVRGPLELQVVLSAESHGVGTAMPFHLYKRHTPRNIFPTPISCMEIAQAIKAALELTMDTYAIDITLHDDDAARVMVCFYPTREAIERVVEVLRLYHAQPVTRRKDTA